MQDKLYFLVGDTIANAFTGTIAALSCLMVFDSEWNMLLAMMLGMALGMFVSLISISLVFIRYFGAMEIMVPTMLGGMLSGMLFAMGITMTELSASDAIVGGALVGLLTLLATRVADSKLRQG